MSLSYVFFDNLLISRYWEQCYTSKNEWIFLSVTNFTYRIAKKIVKQVSVQEIWYYHQFFKKLVILSELSTIHIWIKGTFLFSTKVVAFLYQSISCRAETKKYKSLISFFCLWSSKTTKCLWILLWPFIS